MKERRNLLIGIILGVLISWGIVFLSIPFILKKYSFLLGFVACLGFVSGLLLLLLVWDRQSFKSVMFGAKGSADGVRKINRANIFFKILVIVYILLGVLLAGFYFMTKSKAQQSQLEHQAVLEESARNSGMLALMTNILNKADEELKENSERKLSTELIDRIAALSYSFKPYRWSRRSTKKLSPERGQLLLALAKMNLDSSTFAQIKFKTSFEGADLNGAELRRANLSGVNLKGASLRTADLRGADLSGADLWEVNLWDARMENTNLVGADFKKAKMKWANLSGAKLAQVNLKGADLSNSNLRGIDFRGADLKWAFLNGAFLNGANLAGVELSGTSLKRANLTKADLRKADLKWTDFGEAHLNGADLSDTNMSGANMTGTDLRGANLRNVIFYRVTINDGNWFETLREWEVSGMEEVEERFKIENDVEGVARYRIARVK